MNDDLTSKLQLCEPQMDAVQIKNFGIESEHITDMDTIKQSTKATLPPDPPIGETVKNGLNSERFRLIMPNPKQMDGSKHSAKFMKNHPNETSNQKQKRNRAAKPMTAGQQAKREKLCKLEGRCMGCDSALCGACANCLDRPSSGGRQGDVFLTRWLRGPSWTSILKQPTFCESAARTF